MITPPAGWVLLLCQLSKVDRSCWDQTQQRLGSAYVHHVIGRPVCRARHFSLLLRDKMFCQSIINSLHNYWPIIL
jgi:hypothetical protein